MYLSLTAMFTITTIQVWGISSRLDKWETAVAGPLQARNAQLTRVLNSVENLAKNVDSLSQDSYYDAQSSTIKTAVILTNVEEITHRLATELIPQTSSILYDTNLLLVEAKELVKDLNQEAKVLGPEVAQTTGALTSLLNTLDSEIKSGSPKALQTLETLNRTMTNLDSIIDGDGRKTITNVEKLTEHSAEIAETTDIALKPLRQKRGLLKTIIGIMVGMIRVNINGF